MTNELEKTFFDTFGIEPKCQNKFINPSKCPFNESRGCNDCVCFEYPQISDRILLELICYCYKHPFFLRGLNCNTVEDLKKDILLGLINMLYLPISKESKKKIKHQVRTLFEEG